MIEKRTDRITLTNLGLLADFMIHHFPTLSDWILLANRKRIKEQFTEIGGRKVVEEREEIAVSPIVVKSLAPKPVPSVVEVLETGSTKHPR